MVETANTNCEIINDQSNSKSLLYCTVLRMVYSPCSSNFIIVVTSLINMSKWFCFCLVYFILNLVSLVQK